MPAFTFKLEGVEALTQRLTMMPALIEEEVDAEIGFSCDNIVNRAIVDAPADVGRIRQAITKIKQGAMLYEVVAQTEYAAFIEFGTGLKVQIEPGFEALAASFRNQVGSGSFKEFVAAIAAWVGRKGIAGVYSTGVRKNKDGGLSVGGAVGKRRGSAVRQQVENESIAYAIAVSIYTKGLTPHPFLLHNFAIEEPILIDNIKKVLSSIII